MILIATLALEENMCDIQLYFLLSLLPQSLPSFIPLFDTLILKSQSLLKWLIRTI